MKNMGVSVVHYIMGLDNVNRIMPNLWLGNYQSAEDKNFVVTNKINVVFNCTKSVPFLDVVEHKYRLPVRDSPQDITKMYRMIKEHSDKLYHHLKNKDRVLLISLADQMLGNQVCLTLS